MQAVVFSFRFSDNRYQYRAHRDDKNSMETMTMRAHTKEKAEKEISIAGSHEIFA